MFLDFLEPINLYNPLKVSIQFLCEIDNKTKPPNLLWVLFFNIFFFIERVDQTDVPYKVFTSYDVALNRFVDDRGDGDWKIFSSQVEFRSEIIPVALILF